jgi:lysophospholipase L1-like esterase
MATAHFTVACLGSSSTAGRGQAFDWISTLRRRPENQLTDFKNFGAGGDLAYNALQRLSDVGASGPDIVVVWVGGNDVLAQAVPKVRQFFSRWKRLPREPSPEWFSQSIAAITKRLKLETSAQIALCSLAPIGEDLTATQGLQATLNKLVSKYSEIVREVAAAERCAYLPLWETMTAAMASTPRHSFTQFRFMPFYRDAFRVLVLRKMPDQVAEMNGWRFHTDGVHLNSRAGLLAADLVQSFIKVSRAGIVFR